MLIARPIYVFEGAKCEKCKKGPQPENPVVELISRTRADGHHCIYIHVGCFNKIVNNVTPTRKEGN